MDVRSESLREGKEGKMIKRKRGVEYERRCVRLNK